MSGLTRRTLLQAGAAMAAGSKKRVAAIVTMYTDDSRLKSHAAVIVGRLLNGYAADGVQTAPRTQVVSMYTDQVPSNDLSRGMAAQHGFKIYPTVADALTLGTGKLAVDAVLFVGEHGNYPTNELGQKMYPRFELFSKITEEFRHSHRVVPVFSDKHLSYSWQKARAMYDESVALKFPFMAGSSMPLTVRTPELELPFGCRLDHAVAVGYGDIDAYGFHTLEVLQCMVERRAGAETGIAAVQFLEGPEVWKWRDGEGRWSAPLLDAAVACEPDLKPGKPEDNVARPVAFIVEYRDGFKAAAYLLNGQVRSFLFAGQEKGRDVQATHFGPVDKRRPLPHFDGLVHCIEEMFVTGKPVYPVERTLLTTGTLAFLFESRRKRGRVETPELAVKYSAPRHAYFQHA